MIKFTKLTKYGIRHLEPGGKLIEGGIEFERLSNRDGRYTVNITVDGQRIHRVIGKESEGVSRREAERFIETARTQSRAGRLNLPKGKKCHLTLAQAAQAYQTRLNQTGGKDLRSKRHRLKDHLIPFFGKTALVSIGTYDVECYKQRRQEQGASRATINRELAVLSHLLNWALEWNWLQHLPCHIHKFPERSGCRQYLTLDESIRLLQAAERSPLPHIHRFIRIGLATGMRKQEILSIQISDIDWRKQTIYVPSAKTGDRFQPISQGLAQFLTDDLQRGQANSLWLFPSPDSQSGHQREIRKAFRTVVQQAGLDPAVVVCHILRHTAITQLVQAGVDLPTVQQISGHKTLRMVGHYAHANPSHVQAALELLESHYQNPH